MTSLLHLNNDAVCQKLFEERSEGFFLSGVNIGGVFWGVVWCYFVRLFVCSFFFHVFFSLADQCLIV